MFGEVMTHLDDFIILDKLRRELMYWRYNTLGLKNLKPLIDEIEEKYKEALNEEKS